MSTADVSMDDALSNAGGASAAGQEARDQATALSDVLMEEAGEGIAAAGQAVQAGQQPLAGFSNSGIPLRSRRYPLQCLTSPPLTSLPDKSHGRRSTVSRALSTT